MNMRAFFAKPVSSTSGSVAPPTPLSNITLKLQSSGPAEHGAPKPATAHGSPNPFSPLPTPAPVRDAVNSHFSGGATVTLGPTAGKATAVGGAIEAGSAGQGFAHRRQG